MTFVGGDRLWCGCGNTVYVIDLTKMEIVKSLQLFARKAQLINELVSNGKKVWVIGRQLSSVMELDIETCEVKCVFDCSLVDPTGSILLADPCTVDELALPSRGEDELNSSVSPKQEVEQIQDSSTSSQSSGGEGGAKAQQRRAFEVSNEPQNPSKAPNAIYNQRLTRKTFKSIKKPRTRAYNISHTEGGSGLSSSRSMSDALKRAQIRSLLRQQGATRVTSLLIMEDTLWVARGMGDILLVNISGGSQHGMTLARLSTEDTNKYGNRSNHKLCMVGKEYVVSSQWLEPLDIVRPRGLTESSGPSFSDNEVTTHQQITVWEAWNYDVVQVYTKKLYSMLDMDSDAVNSIDY